MKEHLLYWLLNIIVLAFILFACINIFWMIYAFVKYGNTPASEIPAWALFYMLGRR